MGMYYSQTKNKVFIDWDEKKKEGVEHWHGDFTPINVFYHPKRNELLRVTLKGKMPKWIERFASSIKFKVGTTSDDEGKTGFWLANWNAWESGEKPISSPNLDGAIHQFSKKIPNELKTVKEKIKQNKEIIKENLLKNPKFFEDIGVYYKPEEIKGIKGTLLIDNNIFLDKNDATDEEYARMLEADGRLEKVVWELTTPVPEPIEEVTEDESNEDTEEELFDEDDLIIEDQELLEEFLEENLIEEESELGDEDFLIEDDNEDIIEEDLLSEEIEEILLNEDDVLSPDIEDSDIPNIEQKTLEDELIEEGVLPIESDTIKIEEISVHEEVIQQVEPVTKIVEPAEEKTRNAPRTIIFDLEKAMIVDKPKQKTKRKKVIDETIPLF